MKRVIGLLLAILLLPSLGIAQAPPFVRNSSLASINGADLTPGSASVSVKGVLSVASTDPSSGAQQSIIPISNATSLNGVGSLLVSSSYIATDAAETGSTSTVINATAHVARVGDSIAFKTGTAGNIQAWSVVSAVAANTITVANAFPATPANGDTFYVLRPSATFSTNTPTGYNALAVALDSNAQFSTSSGILKSASSGSYAVSDAIVGAGFRVSVAGGDASLTNNRYAVPQVDAGGSVWTHPIGGSTGGSTTYSKISTADNNSTSIKGSAGTVYSIQASNLNATVRYLKLYNKATAPTCGTDTPVLRIAIPPTSAAGTPITFPTGAAFSLGIGICIVTGITDADNTSTAASEQLVNITYN